MTQKSPSKSTGKSPKRMYSKRYCLTLEGASESQLAAAKKLFDEWEECTLAVLARESGEHATHPHFQGYFELSREMRVRNRLKEVFGDFFHVEPAKGTRFHNLNYVYAVDKAYEIGLIRYTKGEFEVPPRYAAGLNREADLLGNFKPRPFQKFILDEVVGKPADARSIYWFYEERGNVGKTLLSRYLHTFYGAVILGAVDRDSYHCLARVREVTGNDPPVVIFDLCRSSSYCDSSSEFGKLLQTVEKIKDQMFFSGKYESTMLHMKSPPHVIIFANFPPLILGEEKGDLSIDRWKIYEIPSDLRRKPVQKSRSSIISYWKEREPTLFKRSRK